MPENAVPLVLVARLVVSSQLQQAFLGKQNSSAVPKVCHMDSAFAQQTDHRTGSACLKRRFSLTNPYKLLLRLGKGLLQRFLRVGLELRRTRDEQVKVIFEKLGALGSSMAVEYGKEVALVL
jgi:hypothetical protein